MYRLISTIILVLVFGNLRYSSGYKWVTLKKDDPIPEKAIRISTRLENYVGRARNFDEIVPAEIYNSSYALISSCSKEVVKSKFEILVATEQCEWVNYGSIASVPENVVLAGNSWNGEPIYIAKAGDNNYNYRISSIYLTTKKIINWMGILGGSPMNLVCNDDSDWVDSSPEEIPDQPISGGKSEDNLDIFVARLKRGCDITPGQYIPALGIATAIYQGKEIQSPYCETLAGNADKYSWIWAKDGDIPDFSVVGGKHDTGELRYLARVKKTLGYIVHSEALAGNKSYELLVRNVN